MVKETNRRLENKRSCLSLLLTQGKAEVKAEGMRSGKEIDGYCQGAACLTTKPAHDPGAAALFTQHGFQTPSN